MGKAEKSVHKETRREDAGRKENRGGEQRQKPKTKAAALFHRHIGNRCSHYDFDGFPQSGKDQPLGFGDIGSEAPGPPGGDSTSHVLGGSPTTDIIAEYENIYETQLRDILASVVGVGEVEVMVNLESTPELVVEKNRNIRSSTNQEMDKEKATRNQNDQSRDEQVVIVQGGKQDAPVIVKTLKPKVRGVLVVAKGADNIQVKAWITEAVQKVLDVPAYKISILPKKG